MNLQQKIQNLFLSLFGVGYIPLAPGTWGSLLSGIILWGIVHGLQTESLQMWFFILLWGMTLWVSLKFVQHQKPPYDHSWIVIDEFLGMGVTLFPLVIWEQGIFWWLFGFGLFRLFDIRKPLGIRKIDQLHTPLSVLLDDIVAGTYAGLILTILISFSHFLTL